MFVERERSTGMKVEILWSLTAVLLALGGHAMADDANQVKVLMLGDSVTAAGMTDAVGGPLNELTKGKVRWTMVNAGGPGESADGGKLRIGKLLADHKPNVVTISYGLNDISKHATPETFRANMQGILDVIAKEAPGTKVILLTCTPFDIYHHFNGKDKAFNAEGGADLVLDVKYNGVTRALAAERQLPLVDPHRYFLTEKDFAGKYILPDGVHLKPEGYKFVGPYLAKAIAGWYYTEVLKDAKGVELRDRMAARVKKAAETARSAADPDMRKKLLAELDEIWQACPWLPAQAALWHTVYYTGLKPQPVDPQPEKPATSRPG
jgi:lysophospholipase L1-like esterase